MAWVLTRGLTTVRAELNRVFPDRDKTSDGSIGDQAHQAGVSGHNPDITGRAEYRDGDALDEVRAIDVDADLVPGSSVDWMERVIQYLVRRARAGGYIPFRYLIYKERIWNRKYGWETRRYTGANKHHKHAHMSGDYTQKADNWTGSLGLSSLRQPASTTPGGLGSMLVSKGDSNQTVKFWQHVLANLGFYTGEIDGVYGPIMESAVNQHRNSKGWGTLTYISGVHAFVLMQDAFKGQPGKDGRDGRDGEDGEDGRDGILSGTFTITGGTLTVTDQS